MNRHGLAALPRLQGLTVFFYLGTFFSSFGSLLLVMCIPAFFLKASVAVQMIGITIAIHRFAGIASAALFGTGIDRFDSRKIVLWTEVGAAVASLALVFCWEYRDPMGIYPFAIGCGVRAFVAGVQGASRSRLIKLLSVGKADQEASYAIWLNKATQGAHVLSSLAAIPLLAHGSLLGAIAIDSFTFVLGGLAAYLLPEIDLPSMRATKKLNFFHGVRLLLTTHRKSMLPDLVLASAVSGTILLIVRLSNQIPSHVMHFNLIFGVCIWVSSVFIHYPRYRAMRIPYWLALTLGFGLMSLNLGYGFNLTAFFVAYMGYWCLYHKHTANIQVEAHQSEIAATMAVRGLLITAMLSFGELIGGYLPNVLSLRSELQFRSTLCLMLVIACTYVRWNGVESCSDKKSES